MRVPCAVTAAGVPFPDSVADVAARTDVSTGFVPTRSQGHHGGTAHSSPRAPWYRVSRNRCGSGYRNVLGHVWGASQRQCPLV